MPVDVLLQAGQRHAGAGGHLGRGDVDRAQRVEASEAEDQLAAEGHTAADQPGVAALRDERNTGRTARADHGGDLRGRARPDHRRR